MKRDIDSMSYDELIELNHKIVERLKFLDSIHTHKEMMQFSPGDQVCFEPPQVEINNLVHWLSSTKKRLLSLPNQVKNGMSHRIYLIKLKVGKVKKTNRTK